MELFTSPDKNRLVVEIPVRHGKSIYCSHILPCWHMMTFPNRNVTVVSYGGMFASEWSSRNRDLVRDWGPRLAGLQLHPEFASRAHFRLAPPFRGEHRGLGIGGSLAGTGAHLIVADDLIKEFSEVATEEARDRIYMRFHGELLNRLEPGGKILVIMSRRHPDDLSGRLLDSNTELAPEDHWHRITFPALSESGEALWPERYPADKLMAIRRDLEIAGTPWVWHGLYQQDAQHALELTDWPPHFWDNIMVDRVPDFQPRFRLMSLDPSCGKDRRPGDFAGLLAGDVDPEGTLWIHDPRLLRVPLPTLQAEALAMARAHRVDAFAVETNGFQEMIAHDMHRDDPVCPIWAYNSVEVKDVRIRLFLTGLLSAGRVKIVNTPHGRMLKQQLRDFPLAKYDDGPDALSLMAHLWRDLRCGINQQAAGSVPVISR